ncbi:MAG: hypothetical protein V4592_11615 [Bacteroidota bacterium]
MKNLLALLLLFACIPFCHAQKTNKTRATPDSVSKLKALLVLSDNQVVKIKRVFKKQAISIDSLRGTANTNWEELAGKIKALNVKAKIEAVLTPKQAVAYNGLLGETEFGEGVEIGIAKPAPRFKRQGTKKAAMTLPPPDMATPPTSAGPDPIQVTQVGNSAASKGFPFPPPKGYSLQILQRELFEKCATLKDVNRILLSAINKCGYDDHSYYAIPNGFALVTKIEEINSDGTSVAGDARFSLNVHDKMSVFNFFVARKGYFRVFAFIVTNEAFKPTNDVVNQQMAEDWVESGSNMLPAQIGAKKFTEDYACSVIVYEFNAPDANKKLNLVIPAKLSAKVHLVKSNINKNLN